MKTEIAEMAKLMCLIRGRSITTFISTLENPYGLFAEKNRKMNL